MIEVCICNKSNDVRIKAFRCVSCVTFIASVALRTLRALRWTETTFNIHSRHAAAARRTAVTVQHYDSDDSLDADGGHDECRSVATDDADDSSSWSYGGLLVRSAAPSTSSRHSAAASHHSAARDQQPRHGSIDKDGDDEEEEEDGGGEEGGEPDADGATGAPRDRWSTRASGRPTRTRHSDVELKRLQWDAEQQAARRHAVYWPGRADHVRVYHDHAGRGGHAVFERVGQTWFNDDPRYRCLGDSCDDEVDKRRCGQQQVGWEWQRSVEYGPVGPAAVYRCVPINHSTCTDRH